MSALLLFIVETILLCFVSVARNLWHFPSPLPPSAGSSLVYTLGLPRPVPPPLTDGPLGVRHWPGRLRVRMRLTLLTAPWGTSCLPTSQWRTLRLSVCKSPLHSNQVIKWQKQNSVS